MRTRVFTAAPASPALFASLKQGLLQVRKVRLHSLDPVSERRDLNWSAQMFKTSTSLFESEDSFYTS